MSIRISMPKCFHQCQRGRLLDSWLSLMSMNIGLMSTDVMGIFGEVSKVVPLWHSSKHGPHGKML
jgi:hypothetical protein